MTYLPPDPPFEGPAVDLAQTASPAQQKTTPESVLAAPRTPVTRWNRRYLLAGATALAALVAGGFWIGFGGAHRPPPRAAVDEPAADATSTVPSISDRYVKGYGDPAVQAIQAPGTASLPPLGSTPAASVGGQAPSPTKPADPAVQAAREQASAALVASPFFATASTQVAAEPASGAPGILPMAAPAPGLLSEAPAADVQPANGQGGKRQFLSTAKAQDYLANPLREPESPWEVKAGTVIPAALLTAINSDLPGEIIAQVTEPVYDHVTGRTVLIPQGARLIGQYDSQVAYGQARALVAWTRIIMPNGRSLNIGAMSGADLSGAAGLEDQVDGHFWQLARGILLSTVFSVGAASAQDASARSSGALVLNSAGNGISNGAEEVGQQITQRDLNRQPTIKVRAGWSLRVLVDRDMILAPYP